MSSRKDEIVAAALRIADRDGFDAVSMRRIATELGVGTMTLYTYVPNRDALLFEMGERLGLQLLVPAGELSADWREALRQIARRSYDLWLKHPWIVQLAGVDARIGPAFARHIDQSLQAVAGLDADPATRQQVIRAVDAYVAGCVLDALDDPPDTPRFRTDLRDLAEREGLAHIRRALDEDGLDRAPDFERGLDWLIAGIEASIG